MRSQVEPRHTNANRPATPLARGGVRMRTAMWLALAYLTANYLIYPSIAKGVAVGLIFTFMIISREEVINE